MAASRSLAASDLALGTALDVQAARAQAWHASVGGEIQHQQLTGHAPTVPQAIADKSLFDQFRAANAIYLSQLIDRRDTSLATANWLAVGPVAALTSLLLLIGVLVARRSSHRTAARAERQRELRELLQVSASEAESQQLLIRHVERVAPGAGAAVLNRSETEDRLEVALAGDVPSGPMQGTRPPNYGDAPAWRSGSAGPTSVARAPSCCWSATSVDASPARSHASHCSSAVA